MFKPLTTPAPVEFLHNISVDSRANVLFFQGLSIIISCIRYHHPVGPMAALGIAVVFLSLFTRFYCSFRMRSKKAPNHHSTFRV